MANIVIAVVIKFVFADLLLFAQESRGQSVRRLSRKIVFDENDEGAFEVLSNTDAVSCIDECKDDTRCIGVNFHKQWKTCHTIYNIGPEVTYKATIEKKSRSMCWEKDPSKREALLPTTAIPSTTETTTSAPLMSPTAPNSTVPNSTAPNSTAPNSTAPNSTAPNSTAPNSTAPNSTAPNSTAPNSTAPNSTAPNMYDYDVTPPDTTQNSETTTVSTNSGATTRGNVETTPRNPQDPSTTLEDEPVTKSTSSSQERKTTNGDSENNPNVSGTTSTTQFVTTSINGQPVSSPPEGTTSYNVNPEVSPTTTAATTDGVTTQTTSLISGSHGTTSSPNPCDDDPFHKDCIILTRVCMPPKKIKHIERLGNMYTVGSKQAFVCYDQTTHKWYSQIIQCTDRGIWDNMDTVCSYHYPIKVKRKQMMYKFVDVLATQEEASAKCRLEHASLLKVNDGKVIRALEENFPSLKGYYWTDVTKEGLGNWYTSDGVWVNVFNKNVFETSNPLWLLNPILDGSCAYLQPIFRLLTGWCLVARPFICEMTM